MAQPAARPTRRAVGVIPIRQREWKNQYPSTSETKLSNGLSAWWIVHSQTRIGITTEITNTRRLLRHPTALLESQPNTDFPGQLKTLLTWSYYPKSGDGTEGIHAKAQRRKVKRLYRHPPIG